MDSVEWKRIEKKGQVQILDQYLSDAYFLFQRMEYPRISAYQFIIYFLIKLICENNTFAGFDEIKNSLSAFTKAGDLPYDFRWSIRDDDGYIISKR